MPSGSLPEGVTVFTVDYMVRIGGNGSRRCLAVRADDSERVVDFARAGDAEGTFGAS